MEAEKQADPTQPVPSAQQPDVVHPKSIAIAQSIGAVLFTFGSACFVWAAWADDWVQPLRIGCAAWIGGCVPYLWPPLRSEYLGAGRDASAVVRYTTHLSNALQVAGMVSWAVGSAYAFHDELDIGLVVTKAGYLIGSACLLCDALLQALSQATPSSRDEKAALLADLLAGLFYVLAGGFEGYATATELMRFGSCCWLVGSLFSCVRPCLALSEDGRARWSRPAVPARKSVELEQVQVVGRS